MNHEELLEKMENIIHNLNDNGLSTMYYLIEDMDKIEKYNINTSAERIEEIKLLEAEEYKREITENKKKEEKETFERMKKCIGEREKTIESFKGKEKIFWNKIEKVKKMDISRYTMEAWQMMLICDLYDNSYLGAGYENFCYGFYQGMQYAKNQTKKKAENK